jgi:beta-1,4-mannooligosaccharide/beta-1,4-mannosyl-N-acetylglucosamine phosphorylase
MDRNPVGDLKSSPVIKRYSGNPVLSDKDVPYEATLVYNAGICKFQGKYVMVFRNDVYSKRAMGFYKYINLGLAFSDDGIQWKVQPKPILDQTYFNDPEITRVYDPRLTAMDGRCYLCFAVDTRHGLRGGMAVTDDFYKWDVLSMTVPDNRNMVLLPEKFGGKYVRLERPFPVYSRDGVDRFDIWASDSPDLKYWGNSKLVLAVEHLPYANDKIGPGAPPVKTRKGWLAVIHTVDRDNSRGKNGWEEKWQKRYCAGLMLLDLKDPMKVIGYSKEPLLAPETAYELSGGIRNNVIFPGGMILEDSGEVKIYYGAADTVECLATAHVDDLLALCTAKL